MRDKVVPELSRTKFLLPLIGLGFSAGVIVALLWPTAHKSIKSPVAAPSGPTITVVDGDTVDLAGKRHRILGYDTPEIYHAHCQTEREAGLKAAAHLISLIAAGTAKLETTTKREKYGRGLSRLLVDGVDVAVPMIDSGHARPYDGGKRQSWCE